jgi:hypothetical protein
MVIEQSIKQGIYEIRTVCDSAGQRVELVSGRDTEAYPQDTGIGLLLAMLLRHGVSAMEGKVEAAAFQLIGADPERLEQSFQFGTRPLIGQAS